MFTYHENNEINSAHGNLKQYVITAGPIYIIIFKSLSISFLIYVFIIREVQIPPNNG